MNSISLKLVFFFFCSHPYKFESICHVHLFAYRICVKMNHCTLVLGEGSIWVYTNGMRQSWTDVSEEFNMPNNSLSRSTACENKNFFPHFFLDHKITLWSSFKNLQCWSTIMDLPNPSGSTVNTLKSCIIPIWELEILWKERKYTKGKIKLKKGEYYKYLYSFHSLFVFFRHHTYYHWDFEVLGNIYTKTSGCPEIKVVEKKFFFSNRAIFVCT